MPSATKMPPSAIIKYPNCEEDFTPSANSFAFSIVSQSSHSLPETLNNKPPPMAIKIPPATGFLFFL